MLVGWSRARYKRHKTQDTRKQTIHLPSRLSASRPRRPGLAFCVPICSTPLKQICRNADVALPRLMVHKTHKTQTINNAFAQQAASVKTEEAWICRLPINFQHACQQICR